MVKINFQNNITKANADTFNTMQDNIEDAIDEAQLDIYSTTETRIGTYDSKPLYRIILSKTGGSNNSEYIGNISNVQTVVFMNVIVEKSNVFRNGTTCYYGNLSWASQIYFNKSNGYLSIECGNDYASFKNGATIRAVVEYTKTTD